MCRKLVDATVASRRDAGRVPFARAGAAADQMPRFRSKRRFCTGVQKNRSNAGSELACGWGRNSPPGKTLALLT